MLSRVSLAETVLRSAILAMLLGVLPVGARGATAAAAGAPAAGANEVTPPQGPTIFAGLELSQIYQPDTWQPVRLQFRNATDRGIDGSAVLPLSHPKAPAVLTLPLTVPPNSLVTATLWGYFPPPPKLTQQQQQQQQRVAKNAGLGMAEWRDAAGSLLSRAELQGIPFTGTTGHEGQSPEVILLVNQRATTLGDEYETQLLVDHLNETPGPPLQMVAIAPDALSRQASGLRTLKAIVLDGVDPQAFDAAQRAALLEYVRGGGVIVLSAPVDAVATSGTWLAPLLPVSLIGTREAKQLDVLPGGAALKLRRPVPIVEATAVGTCQVLLGDRDYIHAAIQPVGLGQVVFTSFPVNALDTAQPQAATLWARLLSLPEPQWDWNRSQLGEARHDVIAGMIGRKVPPWAIAAGVAGGYLLVIIAAQGFFFGAARPRAFAVTVVVALLVSAALIVIGATRHRGNRTLQAARLGVIDISPDGGGWTRESIAYVGVEDPQMKLQPLDESVMLRPALADARNRPALREQPFGVDKAQVFTDRVERVWEAVRPVPPAWRISATARIGSGGLTVDVDNQLGRPIESPLVIWNGRSMAMPDLPVGPTSIRDLQLNPRQQFVGRGVLTSEQTKRRAQVVAASLAPANETSVNDSADAPPMLVGWIADGGEPLVKPVDRATVEMKSMVMVRTPLRFDVAPVSSGVSIPEALVRVDTGRLPYDRGKGESVPTPQGGSWQITFAPPPQTGRVKPDHITVAARVTLPAHTMRVRMASANEPIEWSRKSGAIETTFKCASGDYDDNGRVRMTLEVESLDPTNTVPWQISDLRATMDGTIVGPPEPIVLDTTTTQPATQSAAHAADAAQEK